MEVRREMRVNEAKWLLGLCVDGCRCKKKEEGRESGCGQEFVVGGVIGDSGAFWGWPVVLAESVRTGGYAKTTPLMLLPLMPRPRITTVFLHRMRRSIT